MRIPHLKHVLTSLIGVILVPETDEFFVLSETSVERFVLHLIFVKKHI